MATLNELLAAGEVKQAEEQATRRLTQAPGDVEALLVLARMAAAQGRLPQADEWLQRAAVKGETPEVVLVRAALALQRQDWVGARRYYEPLTRQSPPPAEAWYGLGIVCAAQDDLGGAQRALENAVRAQPEQASFRFELGRVLALSQQVRPALRQFVLAARLAPGDTRGYRVIADLAAQRGKALQARRVLEFGLREVPEASVLREALEALSASGAPPDEDAQGELVRKVSALLEGRRNREALELLREASTRGLRTVPLKLLEASACEGLLPSDVTGALRAYEEALALDPEDWVASTNMGLFLLRQGQRHVPRAIEVLEQARRRAPSRPEPALNLAIAYVRAGRNAEAAPLARQLEAGLPPDHPLRPQARSLAELLRTA